jgi:hypothetical protein
MQISLRQPQDRDRLNRLIAGEHNAKQRDRYRAVYWAMEGLSAQAVADKARPQRSLRPTLGLRGTDAASWYARPGL